MYEGLLGGHLEPLMEGSNTLRVMGEHAALQESGTFYTPDWVVTFLVEKTLSPLIREIDSSPVVKKAIKNGQRDNSFARLALTLKIVDPAMGSGHFLVRATEWLADRIIEHPTTLLTGDSETDNETHVQAETAFWRRRVVESCIY